MIDQQVRLRLLLTSTLHSHTSLSDYVTSRKTELDSTVFYRATLNAATNHRTDRCCRDTDTGVRQLRV